MTAWKSAKVSGNPLRLRGVMRALVTHRVSAGTTRFPKYNVPRLGNYCYSVYTSTPARGTVRMARKSQQRPVKVAEFLEDMRSGLGDPGLMKKYHLSEANLTKVLGELLRRGFVSASQLAERSTIRDSQIMKAFVEDKEGLKIID